MIFDIYLKMIDQESSLDWADLRSLNYSYLGSDRFMIVPSGYSSVLSEKMELFKPTSQITQPQLTQNQCEEYYNILFSPQQTKSSLLKRNQDLQMKYFDDSDSCHEQIYERRKQRVSMMNKKESQQISLFRQLKEKDYSHYVALGSFMKVFAMVKMQTRTIRNDYYSDKTFTTLQRTPEKQLRAATRVAYQILQQIMMLPPFQTSMVRKNIDERLIEFLIIPRFLISKDKVKRFVEDEELQKNFKILIYSGCLGHYNNEANKKLPEQNYMNTVRELLMQKNGRQKFKKISSINHGGKFRTLNRQNYLKLFSKKLTSLKTLEKQLKKNPKKINKFVQQVDHLSNEDKISLDNQKKIQLICQGINNQHEEIDDNFSEFINSECKLGEVQLTKVGSINVQRNDKRVFPKKIKKSQSLPNQKPERKSNVCFSFMKRALTTPLCIQEEYEEEEQIE